MRTCDVAIVGLGLMGSSALHSLSGRGADVLGFDPLIVGKLVAPRTARAGSIGDSTSKAKPIPTSATAPSRGGARWNRAAAGPF